MRSRVREHPAEVKSQGQSQNQSYAIDRIEPHLYFHQATHSQRGEGAALNHKRHIGTRGTRGKRETRAVMTMTL